MDGLKDGRTNGWTVLETECYLGVICIFFTLYGVDIMQTSWNSKVLKPIVNAYCKLTDTTEQNELHD